MPVDDPVAHSLRAVVRVRRGPDRDACEPQIRIRKRDRDNTNELAGSGQLEDLSLVVVDDEQGSSLGIAPDALAVPDSVLADVEVRRHVVSVAEDSGDGIDVVDLLAGSVADEEMT